MTKPTRRWREDGLEGKSGRLLDGDDRVLTETLGDRLDRQETSDRLGWIFGVARVTIGEMRLRSESVARSLLALDVSPGDVVAVWTPNLPEFAACLYACARIGAVILPLSTRFKSTELAHALRHSDAKVLVMVDRFLRFDFVSLLREVCPEWTAGAVASEALPALKSVVSVTPGSVSGALPWTDFLALADTVTPDTLRRRQAERRWDEPVVLQYTSGTTSAPKGALVNHRYVLNFGTDYTARTGIRAGEAFLNTQPFYHVGGSCGALPLPLTLGCVVVSPEYYEPEAVLALIQRERCVSRSGYGAMYIMEMNHPRFRDYDISSLRGGWTVGSPALMEQIRTVMDIPDLVQIYASTEAGGTGGSVSEPWDVRSTTCGRAVAGTEIAIWEPGTRHTLPAGEVGEIVLRGWWRMNGYLKQPEETAKVIDPDGWVHTGDLGTLDATGHLRFAGRIKDMLKVGGENVAAQEVEAVLLQHPDVKQAAVIGAPDPRLTEVVMAVVELRAGRSLDEAEIIAFCAERMANFRVPRYVRFVTDWPLTESGKIQKRLLNEMLLAEPQKGV